MKQKEIENYIIHNTYKSPRQYKIKDMNIYIYKYIYIYIYIYIYHTSDMIYYSIWQDINETWPYTTLHNMGAHLGSSK